MAKTAHRLSLTIGVRLTRLSIRTLGFSRTVRLLGKLSDGGHGDPEALDHIKALATTVKDVSGSPYHASCLDRSVFLWFLLRRRGLDSALRIGIDLDSGELEGHAWVEYQGSVINDDTDIADRFTVFDEDPTGIVFT